jgi:hypothetical protein
MAINLVVAGGWSHRWLVAPGWSHQQITYDPWLICTHSSRGGASWLPFL